MHMKDAVPNIIAGGTKADEFYKTPLAAGDRAERHTLDISYTIKNEEEYSELSVTVTYTAVAAGHPVALTLKATTLFFIQHDNDAFLRQPTNPKTIAVVSELTQTALAHTRVFAMLAAAREGYKMLMPYQPGAVIEQIVRESLLSSLN